MGEELLNALQKDFDALDSLQQQLDARREHEEELATDPNEEKKDLSGKMDFCDKCNYRYADGRRLDDLARKKFKACAINYKKIEGGEYAV